MLPRSPFLRLCILTAIAAGAVVALWAGVTGRMQTAQPSALTAQVSRCGNGTINTGETCDDGNNANGDGCSGTCVVESGWTCTGMIPSRCGRTTTQPPPPMCNAQEDSTAITEYSTRIVTSFLPARNIASGPDGNLWFTMSGRNKIGRITPGGAVTEYRIPTDSSFPRSIAAGPDGNLWFTEFNYDTIGRITTDGAITEFPLPDTSSLQLGDIAAGPDGNLWFTSTNMRKIGRITPGGAITEYQTDYGVIGIASGPDGNLWLTMPGANSIGRITPGGAITKYLLTTFFSYPRGITAGPDGNMWFTEYRTNRIGKITPDGAITEFPLPYTAIQPDDIIVGPDGNLWFTMDGANKIGRITTDGAITEYPLLGISPISIISGPDGNLWFTRTVTGGQGSGAGKIGKILLLCTPSSPDITIILCGNARRESGEQCDDGNAQNGDGCSDQCRVEPDWECRQESSMSQMVRIKGNPGVVRGTDFTFIGNFSGTLNDDISNMVVEVKKEGDIESPRVANLIPSVEWKKSVAIPGDSRTYYEARPADGSNYIVRETLENLYLDGLWYSAAFIDLPSGNYTARVKVRLKNGASYYVDNYNQTFIIMNPALNPRIQFGEPNIAYNPNAGTMTVTYIMDNFMYFNPSWTFLYGWYVGASRRGIPMDCVRQGTSSHSCSATLTNIPSDGHAVTFFMMTMNRDAPLSDQQESSQKNFSMNPDGAWRDVTPPSSFTFSSSPNKDLTWLSDGSKILVRTKIISNPPDAPYKAIILYFGRKIVLDKSECEAPGKCFYTGEIPNPENGTVGTSIRIYHSISFDTATGMGLIAESKNFQGSLLPLAGRVTFSTVPALTVVPPSTPTASPTVTAGFFVNIAAVVGFMGPYGVNLYGSVEVQKPDGSWISSDPVSLLNFNGTHINVKGLQLGTTYTNYRLIITAESTQPTEKFMRWQEQTPVKPFTTPQWPTANLLGRFLALFSRGAQTVEPQLLTAQVGLNSSSSSIPSSSQSSVMGRDICTRIVSSRSSSVSSPQDCAGERYSYTIADPSIVKETPGQEGTGSFTCLATGESDVRIRGLCSGEEFTVTISCTAPGAASVPSARSALPLRQLSPSSVAPIFICTTICGDWKVKGNEECDDGNTVSGDGCSAACTREVRWCCAARQNGALPVINRMATCDGTIYFLPVGQQPIARHKESCAWSMRLDGVCQRWEVPGGAYPYPSDCSATTGTTSVP